MEVFLELANYGEIEEWTDVLDPALVRATESVHPLLVPLAFSRCIY